MSDIVKSIVTLILPFVPSYSFFTRMGFAGKNILEVPMTSQLISGLRKLD